MNMKIKKQRYLSAKEIAKENANYFIDEQGVSLPWKLEYFNHPHQELDCEVTLFCHRTFKDELLLLDTSGAIWRYYSDINELQTTKLSFTEKVYAIESIGETLILQFQERIEARSLSNGQIIWGKPILEQTTLHKYAKESITLYETSSNKLIFLNVGGETISSIENPQLENFESYRNDSKGKIWYLNSDNTLGYRLQSRQYIRSGKPLYLRIDSFSNNTRWHRMLMDYEIPDEGDIRIEIASSNTSQKPTEDFYIKIDNLHPDLLLPELQGQYLFLKIYLIGNQSYLDSPRIRSIKLIYPRSTYLEHLPACYQEDAKSAEIMEHFLSIFETVFSTLEHSRASTPSLLDTQESPKENLAWLSGWLGLTYDESWDESRWRKLMAEAPKLFDIRGTREGIERVIEIYSDMRPLIQEPMHTHCLSQWKIVKTIDYKKWEKLDKNAYKKVALKKIDNYSFCVFLKPEQYHKKEEVKTIRRIVEEWKPAYTKARVVALEHRILLGSFVFLGINTKLEKRKEYLGEVRIPFDGLAPARKDDNRTLERVRIGNDAILH